MSGGMITGYLLINSCDGCPIVPCAFDSEQAALDLATSLESGEEKPSGGHILTVFGIDPSTPDLIPLWQNFSDADPHRMLGPWRPTPQRLNLEALVVCEHQVDAANVRIWSEQGVRFADEAYEVPA